MGRMTAKLPSAHRRASVSLFRTAGWLESVFDIRLRPHDLSAQQVRVLSMLVAKGDEGLTVGELREGMTDPNSNISRLLNKLMDKGHIAKVRQSDDQRVVRIQLTPQGRDACERAQQALTTEEAVWSRLTAAEAETLADLLDRLRG